MEPTSILIVEDDAKLGQLLEEYLQAQGFVVGLERRGDTAIQRILDEMPDMTILDLMLPGADGYEVCREVRAQYRGLILMLTSRKADIDQIVGLELGADDYVTKPVEPRLLLARIRTLLRRFQRGGTAPEQAPKKLDAHVSIGAFRIDSALRDVSYAGTPVELTAAEFDLLWYLVSRRGEVITRQELYMNLRGIQYNGLDRGMDIHISRIRRKIREVGGEMGFLESIRGSGYLVIERS